VLLYDPVMLDATSIVAALDSAGYRVTGPRRRLAELVAGQDGHFTASELATLAKARRLGISRATFFRALDLLAELGVVERIVLPSGEHAYVACARSHHHHIVCSRCGRTAEVADQGLAEAVAAMARDSGYRIQTHWLELFGLCRYCQRRVADEA